MIPELLNILISTKDLYLKAGRHDLVEAVSLEVSEGEIVSVIGPNGAGKSTAMKAIFGMLNLREGTVMLDGRDITRLSPQAHAARLAARALGRRRGSRAATAAASRESKSVDAARRPYSYFRKDIRAYLFWDSSTFFCSFY